MLRQRSGLSVRDLAERAGINQQSLRKIEQDSQSPRVDLLIRLLDLLGADFDTFMAMDEQAERGNRRTLVRAESGTLLTVSGHPQRLLNAELGQTKMLPVSTRLKASSTGGPLIEQHPGEVLLMVLQGRGVLRLPDYQPLVLKQGDSVYFDGGRGYQIDNPDSDEASLLTLLSLG